MFLIDWILIIIGSSFLLFCFLIYLFFNRLADWFFEHDLYSLFICVGITCVFFPVLLDVFYNRCEVCEKYVISDYCTTCGSFVAGDSVCSCGSELVYGYSFCPSCGLEVSHD